jgi:nucleoside-diphosphate-sugar epimerase
MYKKKKLTVTIIGCGWLGLALGEQLAKEGYYVNGSTRSRANFGALEAKGIQPFTYNLESDLVLPVEIATTTSVLLITAPPIHRDSTLVYGKCLAQLINQFPNTTRILFTSSTGVYPKTAGVYKEDFAFDSSNKEDPILNAEMVVMNSGANPVILRLGGLIGLNRHPVWSIQGKKGLQNPDGVINFVQRDDVIRAIQSILLHPSVSGIFNVVYPLHPTRIDYYKKAAEYYGVPAPEFSDSASFKRIISSEKLCRSVDFNFKKSIEGFPSVIWH